MTALHHFDLNIPCRSVHCTYVRLKNFSLLLRSFAKQVMGWALKLKLKIPGEANLGITCFGDKCQKVCLETD